jgi:hypothetical protein
MTSRRLGKIDPDSAWKSIIDDDNWMFKIGVGGVASASSALLFVMSGSMMVFGPLAFALFACLVGYVLRTIRYKVLNPQCKLPDWDVPSELLVSGLTWIAIHFGFMLIPISILTFIVFFGVTSGMESASHPLFFAWSIPSGIILGASWVCVNFLLSYLMVNFAVEETPRSGFAIGKVFRRFFSNKKEMTLAWLLGIGTVIASLVVPTITIIGIFLVPSTFFMGLAMSSTYLAQAWGPD